MTDKSYFSYDHYSLLGYLSMVVISKGEIDPSKMRCNEATHPEHKIHTYPFDSRASTTLLDGSMIEGHDDWDCLSDFVDAGWVVLNGLKVSLTDEGNRVKESLLSYYDNHKTVEGFSLKDVGSVI